MSVFKDLNYLSWEPVLQHYGLRTRWLDIVDNLSIGLWFATYNSEKQEFSKLENNYLYLFGLDASNPKGYGIWEGDEQLLIDLRQAIPPNALRPHVQHALLFCNKYLLENQYQKYSRPELKNLADYSKYLLGIIEFPSSIGKNLFSNEDRIVDLFASNTLFPKEDEFLSKLKDFDKTLDKKGMRSSFEEHVGIIK